MSVKYSFRGSPSSDLSIQNLWSKTSNINTNNNLTVSQENVSNNILTTIEILGGTESNPTIIDLSKNVNILSNGYFTLNDGIEGQILYLCSGTISGWRNILVFIDHLKSNVNNNYQNALYYPFNGSSVSVLLFTRTSWQIVTGATFD